MSPSLPSGCLGFSLPALSPSLTPGVNDAVNSAQWTPVNVPTNIMLSNSNSSVYTDRVVLAQNRESTINAELTAEPGGTSTWTGKVAG